MIHITFTRGLSIFFSLARWDSMCPKSIKFHVHLCVIWWIQIGFFRRKFLFCPFFGINDNVCVCFQKQICQPNSNNKLFMENPNWHVMIFFLFSFFFMKTSREERNSFSFSRPITHITLLENHLNGSYLLFFFPVSFLYNCLSFPFTTSICPCPFNYK